MHPAGRSSMGGNRRHASLEFEVAAMLDCRSARTTAWSLLLSAGKQEPAPCRPVTDTA